MPLSERVLYVVGGVAVFYGTFWVISLITRLIV